ncbi:vitamin K epoxide reductase family protein [bacterium]|jgi:uncharacterized membrane protein|nr:vitamin K epoxide reductase family protein [bacterium]MBT3730236.1 vitamin K epoxide reductase family protein [bacterium]MBT4894964.1 vitamin K epoxide reductase family protein [bacterium]
MKFNITILILSIVGIFDTSYLTIKRFTHKSVNCSVFEGCDFVTTSSYSAILGVPVAVLGIIFYVSVFALTLWYLKSKNKKVLMSILGLSGVGLLMSIWFVYTQAFILDAYCLYCLVSAGLSTTIFILSLIAVLKSKDTNITIDTQYETNN